MSASIAQNEDIDILEQDIEEISPFLLKILLQDKTTDKNIRFACDEYAKHGEAYTAEKEILPDLIIGKNTKIIQPRTAKSKAEQANRTRKSAEVFTPSWICNEMNNLCDEEWFGRKDVFNIQNEHNWKPTTAPVWFEKNNKRKKAGWQQYVDSKRLEITCGEAPYLVSRYDTTTGEFLPIEKRIGILDRKLRVVNENTDNETDWFKWAKRAFEATYGYEYQGDNLLLARENLLWTFIDNFKFKHKKLPTLSQIKQIANVIAWNIWQMDGLKDCVPFGAADNPQLELFNNVSAINSLIDCKIKNWRNKNIFFFRTIKGGKTMKFDVAIGNPAYQASNETYNRQEPIYPLFYDAVEVIADKSILISPARFLFDNGLTAKEWNQKMLQDTHIKVERFEPNSSKIFPSTDIKGGIVIIYRDNKKKFCAIGDFIPDDTLRSISTKFTKDVDSNLPSIMFGGRSDLKFNNVYLKDYPESIQKRLQAVQKKHPNVKELNPNEEYELKSSTIDVLTDCGLYETKPDKLCYKILGLCNMKRVFRFIEKRYMIARYPNHNNIESYKVFVPESNGSGAIGEVLSTPLIGTPLIGTPLMSSTPTFISIGNFNNQDEAEHLLKYIKTKLVRTLLGILKKTQHNPVSTWAYVPLQDFTDKSDIDWSKSVHEIDLQLYKKYGLDANEINFIETHVKPME